MAKRPRTLREWMEARGETDATLAGRVGVTRSQINRIKHGASRPGIDTAIALEAITRIPMDRLLKGEA